MANPYLSADHAVVFSELPGSSPLDYLQEIGTIIGASCIHSYYLNDGLIKIYLKEQKYVEKVSYSGINILGHKILPNKNVQPSTFRLTISKLDPIVPDSYLKDQLKIYGTVVSSVTYQNLSENAEFEHIESDVRYVDLKVPNGVSIPATIQVKFKDILYVVEIRAKKIPSKKSIGPRRGVNANIDLLRNDHFIFDDESSNHSSLFSIESKSDVSARKNPHRSAKKVKNNDQTESMVQIPDKSNSVLCNSDKTDSLLQNFDQSSTSIPVGEGVNKRSLLQNEKIKSGGLVVDLTPHSCLPESENSVQESLDLLQYKQCLLPNTLSICDLSLPKKAEIRYTYPKEKQIVKSGKVLKELFLKNLSGRNERCTTNHLISRSQRPSESSPNKSVISELLSVHKTQKQINKRVRFCTLNKICDIQLSREVGLTLQSDSRGDVNDTVQNETSLQDVTSVFNTNQIPPRKPVPKQKFVKTSKPSTRSLSEEKPESSYSKNKLPLLAILSSNNDFEHSTNIDRELSTPKASSYMKTFQIKSKSDAIFDSLIADTQNIGDSTVLFQNGESSKYLNSNSVKNKSQVLNEQSSGSSIVTLPLNIEFNYIPTSLDKKRIPCLKLKDDSTKEESSLDQPSRLRLRPRKSKSGTDKMSMPTLSQEISWEDNSSMFMNKEGRTSNFSSRNNSPSNDRSGIKHLRSKFKKAQTSTDPTSMPVLPKEISFKDNSKLLNKEKSHSDNYSSPDSSSVKLQTNRFRKAKLNKIYMPMSPLSSEEDIDSPLALNEGISASPLAVDNSTKELAVRQLQSLISISKTKPSKDHLALSVLPDVAGKNDVSLLLDKEKYNIKSSLTKEKAVKQLMSLKTKKGKTNTDLSSKSSALQDIALKDGSGSLNKDIQQCPNSNNSSSKDNSIAKLPNKDSPSVNMSVKDNSTVKLSDIDSSDAKLTDKDSSDAKLTDKDSSDAKLPDKDSSDTKLPDKDSSAVKLPDKDSSNVKLPDKDSSAVKLPDKDSSNVKLPDKDSSAVKLPDKDSSNVKLPDKNSSDVKLPDKDSPSLKLSDMDSLAAKLSDMDSLAAKLTNKDSSAAKLTNKGSSATKQFDKIKPCKKISDKDSSDVKLLNKDSSAVKLSDKDCSAAKLINKDSSAVIKAKTTTKKSLSDLSSSITSENISSSLDNKSECSDLNFTSNKHSPAESPIKNQQSVSQTSIDQITTPDLPQDVSSLLGKRKSQSLDVIVNLIKKKSRRTSETIILEQTGSHSIPNAEENLTSNSISDLDLNTASCNTSPSLVLNEEVLSGSNSKVSENNTSSAMELNDKNCFESNLKTTEKHSFDTQSVLQEKSSLSISKVVDTGIPVMSSSVSNEENSAPELPLNNEKLQCSNMKTNLYVDSQRNSNEKSSNDTNKEESLLTNDTEELKINVNLESTSVSRITSNHASLSSNKGKPQCLDQTSDQSSDCTKDLGERPCEKLKSLDLNRQLSGQSLDQLKNENNSCKQDNKALKLNPTNALTKEVNLATSGVVSNLEQDTSNSIAHLQSLISVCTNQLTTPVLTDIAVTDDFKLLDEEKSDCPKLKSSSTKDTAVRQLIRLKSKTSIDLRNAQSSLPISIASNDSAVSIDPCHKKNSSMSSKKKLKYEIGSIFHNPKSNLSTQNKSKKTTKKRKVKAKVSKAKFSSKLSSERNKTCVSEYEFYSSDSDSNSLSYSKWRSQKQTPQKRFRSSSVDDINSKASSSAVNDEPYDLSLDRRKMNSTVVTNPRYDYNTLLRKKRERINAICQRVSLINKKNLSGGSLQICKTQEVIDQSIQELPKLKNVNKDQTKGQQIMEPIQLVFHTHITECIPNNIPKTAFPENLASHLEHNLGIPNIRNTGKEQGANNLECQVSRSPDCGPSKSSLNYKATMKSLQKKDFKKSLSQIHAKKVRKRMKKNQVRYMCLQNDGRIVLKKVNTLPANNDNVVVELTNQSPAVLQETTSSISKEFKVHTVDKTAVSADSNSVVNPDSENIDFNSCVNGFLQQLAHCNQKITDKNKFSAQNATKIISTDLASKTTLDAIKCTVPPDVISKKNISLVECQSSEAAVKDCVQEIHPKKTVQILDQTSLDKTPCAASSIDKSNPKNISLSSTKNCIFPNIAVVKDVNQSITAINGSNKECLQKADEDILLNRDGNVQEKVIKFEMSEIAEVNRTSDHGQAGFESSTEDSHFTGYESSDIVDDINQPNLAIRIEAVYSAETLNSIYKDKPNDQNRTEPEISAVVKSEELRLANTTNNVLVGISESSNKVVLVRSEIVAIPDGISREMSIDSIPTSECTVEKDNVESIALFSPKLQVVQEHFNNSKSETEISIGDSDASTHNLEQIKVMDQDLNQSMDTNNSRQGGTVARKPSIKCEIDEDSSNNLCSIDAGENIQSKCILEQSLVKVENPMLTREGLENQVQDSTSSLSSSNRDNAIDSSHQEVIVSSDEDHSQNALCNSNAANKVISSLRKEVKDELVLLSNAKKVVDVPITSCTKLAYPAKNKVISQNPAEKHNDPTSQLTPNTSDTCSLSEMAGDLHSIHEPGSSNETLKLNNSIEDKSQTQPTNNPSEELADSEGHYMIEKTEKPNTFRIYRQVSVSSDKVHGIDHKSSTPVKKVADQSLVPAVASCSNRSVKREYVEEDDKWGPYVAKPKGQAETKRLKGTPTKAQKTTNKKFLPKDKRLNSCLSKNSLPSVEQVGVCSRSSNEALVTSTSDLGPILNGFEDCNKPNDEHSAFASNSSTELASSEASNLNSVSKSPHVDLPSETIKAPCDKTVADSVKVASSDIYSVYRTISKTGTSSVMNFPLSEQSLVKFLQAAKGHKNPKMLALNVLQNNKTPGALKELIVQLYDYFKVCNDKKKQLRVSKLIMLLDNRNK